MLKQKALKGVFWTALSWTFEQGSKFALKIILARLLLPDDFGIAAIAIFIISIFSLLIELGMSTALIQRQDNLIKAVDSAFMVSTILSIISFFIVFIFASSIARFYHNALLSPVIRVMSVSLLFSPLGLIPISILDRELQYRKKFIPEFISVCIYVLATLLLALKGFGVWSLVYGQVIYAIVNSLLLWKASNWKFSFNYDYKIGKELIGYGKHVLIANFLAIILSQGDNAFVGKILGVKELGYYAFAYSIATLTVTNLTTFASRVSFPVFCKLQTSQEEIKKAFLKIIDFILIPVLPVVAVIILLSNEIVRFVFGVKWMPIIQVMRIICISSIFRSLHTTSSYLFQALGRPHLNRNTMFLETVILFTLIIPMTKAWGILGTSFAVLTAMGLCGILAFIIAIKLLKANLKELKNIFFPSLTSFLFTCLAVHFIKSRFFLNTTLLHFIFLIILSMFLYLGAIILLKKGILQEVKEMILLTFSKSKVVI